MIRVHAHIDEIAERDWDALLDARATPFVRWAFLDALESSGCATPPRWRARHLTWWEGGRLAAAAPAYVKHDSEADFSRDFGFADLALRAGIRYYPKLVVGVPITPVTGRRILCAPGVDRAAAARALVDGAWQLAREERLGGIHVLFPLEDDARALEAAGLAMRFGFQAHWVNRGWRTPEEWLAALRSKTRWQARREMAEPARQGITIATVRGAELVERKRELGRLAAGFYQATVSKMMWGHPWLNAAFYERLFERMPEPLELVVATRAGRPVAGAFNVATETHLYGRYWGCHEDHPFLHFNVCLYHSVMDCIRRGLQVFEGGAGGEHKLHRGFEIRPTWSSHGWLDPRLDAALRDYLARETKVRQEEMARRAGQS